MSSICFILLTEERGIIGISYLKIGISLTRRPCAKMTNALTDEPDAKVIDYFIMRTVQHIRETNCTAPLHVNKHKSIKQ